ncbi:pyroglutamyl-peptidase I [Furfurilactobacillus siliginis]|uniref:Pyroglutamyl-peptidase I n=1 Tax=Furfurilactobacillus siliginis TaxID=348151 RepID=A0A0R2L5G3_9LACO|nr:pyroglutamyl-peptidase I [Furfurilactobacillus siliginis]KRN94700.1 pyroglutamyl-peptidase I [Furfurilactobacillus siliginis]GEK28412.1 pyrrolidone-carboxylate peptidase [Furfurilactobacillus siliginis]
MKILVTGFDAFDGATINPAGEVVNQLPNTIAGVTVVKQIIPTIFAESGTVLHDAIVREQPDFLLNVGQAGGRFGITPERIAINLDDASRADNAGQQPRNQSIQSDGPDAYFTQLPVTEIVASIKALGIPSMVSTTAGTFVCNHVMYQAQFMRANEFPFIKAAGFIHIPFLPEQVTDQLSPSMALTDATKGITAAIQTIVTHHYDN